MSIYLPIAEMNINIFLIIFIGMLVGGLSGLFGVGGGFLMTPLLIFLGIPPVVAVGSEAPHVLASSVSGVIAHWRKKNVDFKMGFFLLIGGILGSTFGVNLFKILKNYGQIDIVIQFLFLIFLGFIGFSMAFESAKTTIKNYRTTSIIKSKLHQHSWIHGLPFKMRFHRSKLYISAIPPIIIGFFVGILSAMMGVGGGFIMIPAMVYILGMSTNVVVGTSLFQIIFVTANSTFFQSYLNQTVDIVLSALMIIGGVIGAQIGVLIGSKLKAEYLRGILAILVLLVCAKIFTDLVLEPVDVFSTTII
ncbi:MAG: permease [Pelagibacteraceae bacterium]|nr:permease [Pelagibacteraceae bacterium]|tara:strand:- start:38046 stop:38960 length:915 start_codon:yes stop_codon:yes gene_type:complete